MGCGSLLPDARWCVTAKVESPVCGRQRHEGVERQLSSQLRYPKIPRRTVLLRRFSGQELVAAEALRSSIGRVHSAARPPLKPRPDRYGSPPTPVSLFSAGKPIQYFEVHPLDPGPHFVRSSHLTPPPSYSDFRCRILSIRPFACLTVSFFSREQIRKETAAMGKEETQSEAPWGIISVKSQDVDYEIPMQPITMMRNALGKEEGGSGVPLEREKYLESVKFWREHAPVK